MMSSVNILDLNRSIRERYRREQLLLFVVHCNDERLNMLDSSVVIKVMIRKSTKGTMFLTTSNHIDFVPVDGSVAIDKPYQAIYKRDFGSSSIKIISFESQVETLTRLLFECQNSTNVGYQINFPVDHHLIRGIAPDGDPQFEVAFSPEEITVLFDAVSKEYEEQRIARLTCRQY